MVAELVAGPQIAIPKEVAGKLGLSLGDKFNIAVNGKIITLMPIAETPWATEAKLESEEERRAIVNSLIGSIDDIPFIEPPDAKHESPRNWELLDS